MCTTSLEGTSTRQSLQSKGGSSGGIWTNPPVEEFREYREVEAKVNRLEHREHIRANDACGDTLSLLTA